MSRYQHRHQVIPKLFGCHLRSKTIRRFWAFTTDVKANQAELLNAKDAQTNRRKTHTRVLLDTFQFTRLRCDHTTREGIVYLLGHRLPAKNAKCLGHAHWCIRRQTLYLLLRQFPETNPNIMFMNSQLDREVHVAKCPETGLVRLSMVTASNEPICWSEHGVYTKQQMYRPCTWLSERPMSHWSVWELELLSAVEDQLRPK